jgi:XTP/dITP diphosphohydrolase
VQEEEKYYFDGIVNGHIIREKRGDGGFGYDPIFVPEGYEKTFAELGTEVNNSISHRAHAVAKLAEFLKKEK